MEKIEILKQCTVDGQIIRLPQKQNSKQNSNQLQLELF